MKPWTKKQENTLRGHWKKGLSAAECAKEMGGFEHCADGGRNAVIGFIGRLRKAAEAENDQVKVSFWWRGKGSKKPANMRQKKKAPSKKSWKTSSFTGKQARKQPLLRGHVAEFVGSVSVEIAPPKAPTGTITESRAFPSSNAHSGNPDDLSHGELAALARMYEPRA